VCFGVLQCVAVCCSESNTHVSACLEYIGLLQCAARIYGTVAVCCSESNTHVSTCLEYIGLLQCAARIYGTVAVCRIYKAVAVCFGVLQCVAVC